MDDIELVRSKVDIVELINSYIPLKKIGRNFKALCPFHSEKTPSFIVSPERQIFKCFGCGAGGSAFNFLVEYEKMTFGEALRFLADKAGVKLKSFKPTKSQQEKDKLLSINHLASEFYHFILLNHQVGKKALEYVLKRGIKKSSIELFKLGYAPQSWETLQNFLVKKKGYKSEDLDKAGLTIRGSRGYYDRFRERIIFPLRDHRGNTIGFSGRLIRQAAEDKSGKYINTPETLLYRKREVFYGLLEAKEEIKKKNQAIAVEGEFDVISSYQVGIKNIVAIKGTALTEQQVSLIKRFCDNLYLSMDTDVAGDIAVRRGIEIAEDTGLNIRVVKPLFGKDADECVQKSVQLWKESIKKAIPIYDFYIQSARNRFGIGMPEGKRKISDELTPILAKITNEVMKAHYVKKLAKVLEVSEEAVIREMERKRTLLFRSAGRLAEQDGIIKIKQKREETRAGRLEEYLLALVLAKPEEIKSLLEQIKWNQIKTLVIKKIFEKLKNYLEKKDKFVINDFVKNLPEELIETFDRSYLQELEDVLDNEKKFLKELENTKKEIEKFGLKEEREKLITEIETAEEKSGVDAKEKTRLGDLRKEFARISQKIKLLE